MKIALVDDEHYYLDEMERLCLDFGKRCHLHIETVLFDSGEAQTAQRPYNEHG